MICGAMYCYFKLCTKKRETKLFILFFKSRRRESEYLIEVFLPNELKKYKDKKIKENIKRVSSI